MLSLTPLDSFLPFWLQELNATRPYKKPSEIVEFSCSCAQAKKPTLSTNSDFNDVPSGSRESLPMA